MIIKSPKPSTNKDAKLDTEANVGKTIHGPYGFAFKISNNKNARCKICGNNLSYQNLKNHSSNLRGHLEKMHGGIENAKVRKLKIEFLKIIFSFRFP